MTAYDPFIGQTFEGRYTIVNVIGTGGMATVYGAYDQVTGRSVAIKMMQKKLEHNAKQIKLFINESTALSLLSHPNIVQVYTTAITNSTKYIIMEYVDGITLKKHIDHRGALPEREVLYYATQILSALDYMHSKGIVHCDIKPQNIILLQNGSIKVADFGIARLDAMFDRSKERNDVALGTVYYVSPEQAQGKAPRAESDLYSLGVMLYEAMTNRLPFYNENPTEVARMQINTEPAPPSDFREDISVGLEQIILRAMEKNPKARYATATEMLTDIRALRQNSKTVFGNEKNSSRYRIIDRKAKPGVSNVSNRTIIPINEKGVNFAENQGYFKKNTSNLETFTPREEDIVYNTGKNLSVTGRTAVAPALSHTGKTTVAHTGKNLAQTGATLSQMGGKTQKMPSGSIPAHHSQKLPKTQSSNTIVIEETSKLNGAERESRWLSVMLGVIASLILVILLSFGLWLLIAPEARNGDSRGIQYEIESTETETEWNTEHTEKF